MWEQKSIILMIENKIIIINKITCRINIEYLNFFTHIDKILNHKNYLLVKC